MELADFDQFRKAGPFPSNYPAGVRRFWTQTDDAHAVLKAVIGSCGQNGAAQPSLTLMMFGYDDDELNGMIVKLLADPAVLVEISLDRSQAGGKHERALLDTVPQGFFGNSIAVGHAEFASAISHTKGLQVDDRWVIGGSTNWSLSGERKQNNELVLWDSAVLAADFKTVAHAAHLAMLAEPKHGAR